MGFLTTFTISNDEVSSLSNNCSDFCEKLSESTVGEGKAITFYHGNCAVKVQKPRHSDDHTIYIHMGNTLSEMNVHSRDTEKFMINYPDLFKDKLELMKHQTDELEKKFNELQTKTKMRKK